MLEGDVIGSRVVSDGFMVLFSTVVEDYGRDRGRG